MGPEARAAERQPLIRKADAGPGGGVASPPRPWLGPTASGVFELCSATLGAGALALPQSFAGAGLVPAVVLLGVGATATLFSIRLMMKGIGATGATSLEQLARRSFGPLMEKVVEAGIVLFSLGTSVAYLVAAAELLVGVGFSGRRPALLLFGLVGFLLSLVKQMHALRYTSFFGVLSIGYLVLLTVVHCASTLVGTDAPDFEGHLRQAGVHMFYGSRTGVFQAMPVMIFAFTCQMNVPAILEDMRRRARRKQLQSRVALRRRRLARAVLIVRSRVQGAGWQQDGGSLEARALARASMTVEQGSRSPSMEPAREGKSAAMSLEMFQKLHSAPLAVLADLPLETLEVVQLARVTPDPTALLSPHQRDALADLPLDTLSPEELDDLSRAPLETLSPADMRFVLPTAEAPATMPSGESSDSNLAIHAAGQSEPTPSLDGAGWNVEEGRQNMASTLDALFAEGSAEEEVKIFDPVAVGAVAVCSVIFLFTGFFGALEFGDATADNILSNYSLHGKQGILASIAYVCIVVTITTAYPLVVFPCRVTLLGLVFGHDETAAVADLEQQAKAGIVRGEDVKATERRIWQWHRVSELISFVFCGISLLIALRVPNLKVVFELTGGIASAFVCFVFPPLMAMKLQLLKDSRVDQVAAVALIVGGVLAGSLGTWASITANFVY